MNDGALLMTRTWVELPPTAASEIAEREADNVHPGTTGASTERCSEG